MRALLLLASLTLTGGCALGPRNRLAPDYHPPRSILVLPPLNLSPETGVSGEFLSTITRPLAERGYYVFPVAVVDQMLQDNGLPTPGEMHQVPLSRLREVFHADAVLYIRVTEWGQRYVLLDSVNAVAAECALVDAATGEILFSGQDRQEVRASQGDSGGGSNFLAWLIARLVVSAVAQVAGSLDEDRSRALSRELNQRLFGFALPAGPYLAPAVVPSAGPPAPAVARHGP